MGEFLAKILGAAIVATLMIPALPARAVDGVIEINQASVLAGGITAGDSNGFPVTLSESGSYRLTGRIVVPDAATTAIEILAPNVTIDLNGFSIEGPNVCDGDSCSTSGVGKGILNAQGSSVPASITIRNGLVQGFGSTGIDLPGNQVRVLLENVSSISNGGAGFDCGDSNARTRALSIHASRNGSSGFQGRSVLIDRSEFIDNSGTGITCQDGLVVHSAVSGNGGVGILGANAANIRDSRVATNAAAGIKVGSGSIVAGNTVVQNTGFGLEAGAAGVTYQGNTFEFNNGFGLIQNSANLIETGINYCGGDTACP